MVLFVALALAVGKVGVLAIVALDVLVQPFAPVTVTVYVPASTLLRPAVVAPVFQA